MATLILIALAVGGFVAWERHRASRLAFPPDVRQLEHPRAMARAEHLFRLYSDYLEFNQTRAYPSELKAAPQEARAALVLVMLARARRDETHPTMLEAARSAYTLLREGDPQPPRTVPASPDTAERDAQWQETLRSELAATRLARQEFDTWFRAGLGALGLRPEAVGWQVPDDDTEPGMRMLRAFAGGRGSPSASAASAAEAPGKPEGIAGDDTEAGVDDEKVRWWRARVSEPIGDRFRALDHGLSQHADDARREELRTKIERLTPWFVAILREVGPDRLEVERRRTLFLVTDNYGLVLRRQAETGQPMATREWDTVSALVAGGLAMELALVIEHHEALFTRVYGPDVRIPGPALGRDLLSDHLAAQAASRP